MADKVFEKVFGNDGKQTKVADNIQKEAREAGKKLVGDMVERFKGIGFDPKEVAPIIRKGVKEGSEQ